jgi:hypothetical protein
MLSTSLSKNFLEREIGGCKITRHERDATRLESCATCSHVVHDDILNKWVWSVHLLER